MFAAASSGEMAVRGCSVECFLLLLVGGRRSGLALGQVVSALLGWWTWAVAAGSREWWVGGVDSCRSER